MFFVDIFNYSSAELVSFFRMNPGWKHHANCAFARY